MAAFAPDHEYERAEVARAVGATRSDGSLLLGDDGVALVATLGDAEDQPRFPERSTLHWPGRVPGRVVTLGKPVLVFVDRGSGGGVRFIGEGRVSSYSTTESGPRDVRFTIGPPLARQTWLEFLGGRLPPMVRLQTLPSEGSREKAAHPNGGPRFRISRSGGTTNG
jgi:hypothetical protein